MQVLYIDVLFILNMVMDLFIFISAALFLNHPIRKGRLILGSILAASLYCIGMIVPTLRELPFYLYYFCIPVMPIWIIFRPRAVKMFFKFFLVSHFAAFFIGGAVFNSYYMLIASGRAQSLSIVLPLAIGGLLCVVIYFSSSFIRQRFIMPHFEYDMFLYKGGEKINLKGFLDSGNCLYTLSTHKPVSVVPYETIAPILSENERAMIKKYLERGIMDLLNEVHKEIAKIYLIPYESIGCKEGVLLGIVVDQMVLSKGTYHKGFDECVIGIAAKEVFKGQGYNALIHPDYLLRL